MSDKVPDGWKKYKLGDIVRLNPYSIDSNFKYSQIVYLDTGSIKEGKITELKEYKLTDAPSSAKRLVKNNNIIYSTVRPIQRHYGIIKNPPDNMVVSNGFVVLEAIEEIIDPYFLYYFLTLDKIIDTLEAIAEASSSVYPTFRIPVLENLTIFLPSLPEQRAIASVLSSIDDKIDLLQRENKTLEAMAETLFRQWFIEEAKDEWEEVSIGELSDISSGKGLGKGQFAENGIYPVLGANGLIGKTDKFLYNERLIYTGRVGTLGNVFIVENERVWLSDNTLVIRPHKYFYTVYFILKYSKLEEYNVGSTQPLIRQSDIKRIEFALPCEVVICNFEFMAETFFSKINANKRQIHTLEKLRDTLLPKLMSGEVRVDLCQS